MFTLGCSSGSTRETDKPDAGSTTQEDATEDADTEVDDSQDNLDTKPTCVPTDPPDEICDAKDNDCNGQVDDGALCDDGLACTVDSCSPDKGCEHAPMSCDDNKLCTHDLCMIGAGCVSAPIPNCVG